MSARRRAGSGGQRADEGQGRRPSRTGALRQSRRATRTRMTIVMALLAALCVPLALWIYPRFTSHTQLSRLGLVRLEKSDKGSAQLTGIDRRQEVVDGTFSVHVSCQVYNGTVEPVAGVSVTLTALDGSRATVMAATAEPAAFALQARASRRVRVSLTGLTEQQLEQIALLELASRVGG